jgi:hypothetical protein
VDSQFQETAERYIDSLGQEEVINKAPPFIPESVERFEPRLQTGQNEGKNVFCISNDVGCTRLISVSVPPPDPAVPTLEQAADMEAANLACIQQAE